MNQQRKRKGYCIDGWISTGYDLADFQRQHHTTQAELKLNASMQSKEVVISTHLLGNSFMCGIEKQ